MQIDNASDFVLPLVADVPVDAAAYTPVSAFSDNLSYYWRVQAITSQGLAGAWSDTWVFTIDIARLRAPVLSLPKDRTNTPDQTPTLSWSAVSGAKLYQVQWSNDPDLESAHQGQVTTLTYTVPEQPYGIYFWRVRAQNAVGDWGDWSLTRTLTITILSTPTNAQHLTDDTPTFVWKAALGASSYHLEVYDDEALSHVVFDTDTASLSATSDTILADGQHWWAVRVDRPGGVQLWTPVWTFTVTPSIPLKPALLEPAGGSVQLTNTPFFRWSSVADGARYQIQIDNNDTFASPVQDTETQPVGTTTYTASPLPDGGKFYWRVRAINGVGVAGAWSATWTFTLQQIAAPALRSPANPTSMANSQPVFDWDPVAAASYQIQLSPTSTFAVLSHQAAGITATAYTVPSALPDGKYFWRVRGMTADGVAGKWSMAWVITIDTTGPAQPVLYSPQDLAGTPDTTPTFTWLAATGGKQYHLEVATNPAFTGLLAVDRIQAGLTYTAPSVLDYGTYFWRVQAADALGNWGDFSPARRLAITLQKTPKDRATTTDTTPTFTWAAGAGSSYVLEVDISPDFDSSELPFHYTGSALTATPRAEEALTPGVVYYWHLQILPAGTWMPTWTFVISPTKPAQVVLAAPASGTLTNDSTPTLSWMTVNNATRYQIQIDNQGTFTSPEQDVTVGGTTSYIASDLADALYSWRVRAFNSDGAPGAWAYKRTFTIDTVPLAAPALVAPLDGASSTNTKLTLSWGAVVGTFRYQIQVDPDPDFPLPVIDAGTLLTYKSPTPLSRGSYFWRVRTVDKVGNVSEWSEPRIFTIVAGVTAPPLPTQTPLLTEIPTDEPTITPTLEPTVEPTAEPTVEPTIEPTSEPTTPDASLLVVESDDPHVQTSGNWSTHDTPEASGGRYLFSSGSVDDTLTLNFAGSRIDVVFVQHPALGSFVLIIDGITVQTVNSTAPDAVFGTRVSLNVAAGAHTLRIVPVSGVIAIDAFAVEVISEPLAPPTQDPTNEPVTPEPTAEPVTLEPLTDPQTQPTPDAPANFGHG